MFAQRFNSALTLVFAAALTLAPSAVRAGDPPCQPPIQSQIPKFKVPQPDLVIVGVSALTGNSNKAMVYIHNYGNATAAPCTVMMQEYIGGGNWVAKNSALTSATIPAGGESWFIMNVSVPANAPGHITRYTVDFWNVVAESSENNNYYIIDTIPK